MAKSVDVKNVIKSYVRKKEGESSISSFFFTKGREGYKITKNIVT